MSFHNHDDETIKRINKESEVAKQLREKVDAAKDSAIIAVITATNINGLSKDEALKKLNDAIEEALDDFDLKNPGKNG
jgi:hypothetical protein